MSDKSDKWVINEYQTECTVQPVWKSFYNWKSLEDKQRARKLEMIKICI